MNKALRPFVLAAAVALVLVAVLSAACGGGAARITVEAKDDLKFTPDTITVKAGQPVDLTLVNNGTLDHTFTIPDLSIEVIMRAGETNRITFTAPKPGEYRIICGIHFDKMQAKLIVQ